MNRHFFVGDIFHCPLFWLFFFFFIYLFLTSLTCFEIINKNHFTLIILQQVFLFLSCVSMNSGSSGISWHFCSADKNPDTTINPPQVSSHDVFLLELLPERTPAVSRVGWITGYGSHPTPPQTLLPWEILATEPLHWLLSLLNYTFGPSVIATKVRCASIDPAPSSLWPALKGSQTK